ncbi:MAG: serine acetyltransferase [Dysgonamonadaceae bacterium]
MSPEKGIREIIDNNIEILKSEEEKSDNQYVSRCNCPFPSHDKLIEFVNYVRDICFPGYFEHVEEEDAEHKLRDCFHRIYHILPDQIYFGMSFSKTDDCNLKDRSKELTVEFINKIPEIKRLLGTDVKAMFKNDPAARDETEVILCYPAIRAMLHHRIAHYLFVMGVPILPRVISEIAHSDTGIDIHPGAHIGEYFSIDHGTGVVIGQTSIIGHHVCIYQGVTLGAKSFSLDPQGKPIDLPRHPIIEDYVTIYSNASILGRITIGKHSIIGGNIWVTNSVPAFSRIVQQRAMDVSFSDGAGI